MSKKNCAWRLGLEVTRRCKRALAWSRRATTAFARPGLLVALLLVLVPVCVMMFKPAAKAVPVTNTITVDTTDDPGTSSECSLRAAINNANNKTSDSNSTCAAGTGTDTIVFSVTGTITLGSSLPAIANTSGSSLTIDGGQAITIDGANSYQVLWVNSGATLNLNNLTIADGRALSGAGVLNAGTLTVTSSTFSDNTASHTSLFEPGSPVSGGAIANSGTLTATTTTFSGNVAALGPLGSPCFGGAVANDGMMALTNCSFWANTSQYGGAIINTGTATVSDSTFSNNSATSTSNGDGGGISNSGTLTITNSTFSDNSAILYGGAIANGTGTLTITSSTFSDNAAEYFGGIYNFAESDLATLTNSILANGASGGNCGGTATPPVANGGYNISDDATCGFGTSTGANGDTIGDGVSDANLALDPRGLANNGGLTETIALELGSYAIDAIPIADCPATDQRGYERPAPGYAACDIGAFEYASVPAPTPTPTATNTPTATPTATPTPTTVVLLPSSLNFGTVTVGQSSAPQTVTLTNGTGKKITIRGTAIGRDFVIVSTTCPSPTGMLPAGQSCTYMVVFRPQSAGTKSEVFKVTDSASNSPQKVKLHGIATRL